MNQFIKNNVVTSGVLGGATLIGRTVLVKRENSKDTLGPILNKKEDLKINENELLETSQLSEYENLIKSDNDKRTIVM